MIPVDEATDVLAIEPDRLAADVAYRMFVRLAQAEQAERAARIAADLAFDFRLTGRARLAQAQCVAEADTCVAASRAFDAAHKTMRHTNTPNRRTA